MVNINFYLLYVFLFQNDFADITIELCDAECAKKKNIVLAHIRDL